MDFSYSPKVVDLQKRLTAFMEEHIYPAEASYAAELAANTKTLTAADFKAMGLARCKELQTNARAAPVKPGTTGAAPADEFAGYSINQLLEAK